MLAVWWFFLLCSGGFPGYRFFGAKVTCGTFWLQTQKITILQENHVFSSLWRAFFLKICKQLDSIISWRYLMKKLCEHQPISKNRQFCQICSVRLHSWQKNHQQVPRRCGLMGPDRHRCCHLYIHPLGSHSPDTRVFVFFVEGWAMIKSVYVYTIFRPKTRIFHKNTKKNMKRAGERG